MFYYYLATGEYEDYYEVLLIHEKEYTREEFIDLAKEASSSFDEHYDIEDVSEILIADYGFKEMKQTSANFDDWKREWG